MIKKLFLLIILGVFAYAGFGTYSLHTQAETVQKKAAEVVDEYLILKDENEILRAQQAILYTEHVRCSSYISQDSGDFGEFEYCKKFLDLTKTLELEN